MASKDEDTEPMRRRTNQAIGKLKSKDAFAAVMMTVMSLMMTMRTSKPIESSRSHVVKVNASLITADSHLLSVLSVRVVLHDDSIIA